MDIWSKYPEIWKTQSAFFSWVRGGIRRSLWNRHPIKLEFLKNNRKRIANPNPKGKVAEVWGADCALCNNTFVIKDIEVDHKQGNHSLNSKEDIQTFIESIVFVTEDDLQLVCKDCHKCKSYADKQGISFEEAMIVKKVIDIMKNKTDKKWLIDRGIIPESSQSKRRLQIEKRMQEELYGKDSSDN